MRSGERCDTIGYTYDLWVRSDTLGLGKDTLYLADISGYQWVSMRVMQAGRLLVGWCTNGGYIMSEQKSESKLFYFPRTREGAAELTEIAANQRSRDRLINHMGVVDGKLCIKVTDVMRKPR